MNKVKLFAPSKNFFAQSHELSCMKFPKRKLKQISSCGFSQKLKSAMDLQVSCTWLIKIVILIIHNIKFNRGVKW